METVHILTLDSYNASLRHCRPYQEKVVDSFDNGRLKLAWDVIKEKYFLQNNPLLEEICHACPLNIYQVQQGCQGEIYNLGIFLNFLKIHFPESPVLQYDFTNVKLSFQQVHEIHQDLENISSQIKKIKWPCAAVYYQANPINRPAKDGKEEIFSYPWYGTEEKYFIYGNDAYRFCITKEGIAVERSLVEIPHIFKHLWKQEGKTFGKTLKDEVIVFEEEMGILPTWDPVDPKRESELIFQELSGHLVLRYFIDTLKAFFNIAITHYVGLTVSEII